MDLDTTAQLINSAQGSRNKALISLLAQSGARRSELANIQLADVDIGGRRIKVLGKGNKEGYLIFGSRTQELLEKYVEEYQPEGSLFGLTSYGIQSMLFKLEKKTGIKCNAHSFRRMFAVELRKAGVPELDIVQLGRWSSVSMVQRYTKSYTFEDAATRYQDII